MAHALQYVHMFLSATSSAYNPIEAAAYYVNPSWQRDIDLVLHTVDGDLAHTLAQAGLAGCCALSLWP